MIARRENRNKLLKQMRLDAIRETPYFFVYGSLMERYSNFNRFLRRQVKSIQPAFCPGFLYHLPIGFPGLIAMENCQDLVAGELMSFRKPEKVLRALDQLENFYPDNPEKSIYQRRKLTVIAAADNGNGEFYEQSAWVYTYPLDHLTPEHQKEFFISCGNWKLFSENPVARQRPQLKNLLGKLKKLPRRARSRAATLPPVCLEEEAPIVWASTSICSQYCQHHELCQNNRRKRRENCF
ncbi:MAG: gamma-glutamylcyclotransferase [Deltaproteobacteria bacterium]|nr:gamma-glutamylcyclotransferase [Deltaproteobacteria bacterium]